MSIRITEQELERALRAVADELARPQEDNLCTALAMRYERCGVRPLRSAYSFPCAGWASNRINRLHGGAVAGMLDQGMGALCAAVIGRVPPTVSLSVDYLRPVPVGGRLVVESVADGAGRTLWHIRGTAFLEDAPGEPVATANGVYFAGEYRTE